MSALETIVEDKGKLISLRFTKKDGSRRFMKCVYGVEKGLTGRGLRYNPVECGLLPVYDVEKRDYRMINLGSTEIISIELFSPGENF